MSLKEFLAVGRSFAGSPSEKSPFEMRKDVRLPTFGNAPRFAPRQAAPVQMDWLAEKDHQPVSAEYSESHAAAGPGATPRTKRSRRPWLRFLTLGLFGKGVSDGELVQAEMNLEKVRVIRNDLLDSDLEVVVNKKPKFALRPVKTSPNLPAAAETPVVGEKTPVAEIPIVSEIPKPAMAEKKKSSEWSELTARLFEIGQQ